MQYVDRQLAAVAVLGQPATTLYNHWAFYYRNSRFQNTAGAKKRVYTALQI